MICVMRNLFGHGVRGSVGCGFCGGCAGAGDGEIVAVVTKISAGCQCTTLQYKSMQSV